MREQPINKAEAMSRMLDETQSREVRRDAYFLVMTVEWLEAVQQRGLPLYVVPVEFRERVMDLLKHIHAPSA